MRNTFMHGSGTLKLDKVVVMGVLNVTPDSFSDGGLWMDRDAAIAHGLEMVDQGAGILDIGGESTRPGATPVPLEEELDRVLPVIEGLAERIDVPISIDTRKAEVARRAVAAGASIVNDTQGEADLDPQLYDIVAETEVGVILMHSRGTPETMRSLVDYPDVIEDVGGFLRERASSLEARGVASERIVVDPGVGFAKDPSQSLRLLAGLDRIVALGYPVLVGTSRKSFIGAVLDLPAGERLEATLASVVVAVTRGARIVRVHDVEPTVRAVRMTEAIMASSID